MARNRKRAKERRARQPQPAIGTSNGAPEDEAQLDDSGAVRSGEPGGRADGMPEPLEHAAPDAELAEAQLALGRPDLADEQAARTPDDDEADDEGFDPLEFDELEDEVDAAADDGGDGGFPPGDVPPGGDGGDGGSGGRQLEPSAGAPAPQAAGGNRLINFLRGSWRELQRVQWPDRRQVMQATGVVIGFVIVAGVFLGVADFLAGHLMNYILEGHW